MRSSRILFILVLTIAAISCVINTRNHVSLFGGEDEGSYIAAGKLLSKSIRFVYEDPAAELGKKYLPVGSFVPPGFRVFDETASPVQIVSAWNKGFSLISIPFWWISPNRGWVYVNPLAGALSIVVIFLIGTRICSPSAGVCAALLLATNWLQLWHSRYPMSEVLSQMIILSALLCVVSLGKSPQTKTLVAFSFFATLASLVHFANVPLWGFLGAAICFQFLPFSRDAVPSTESSSRHRWIGRYSFDKQKLPAFTKAGLLAIGLPLALTVTYWFLDPGIQRYTKFAQKMVNTSSRFSQVLEAFWVRLQNLALFVPDVVWIAVVVAFVLFVTNKGMARRWWIIVGGVGAVSFLLLVSSGIGTPRVLYVARRNVPIVLPSLCLIAGVVIHYAASLITLRWLRTAFVVGIAASLSFVQLLDFYPFRKLDQGEGLPEVAASVKKSLAQRYKGRPQFLITTGDSANFRTGLRFVNGVPIIQFSPLVTPDVITRMLADNIDLYFLDDAKRPVGKMLKDAPGVHIAPISNYEVVWLYANQLNPTVYPKVSDKLLLKYYLYRIKKRPPPAEGAS